MKAPTKFSYYVQYRLWQQVTFLNLILLPFSVLYLAISYVKYHYFQKPRKFDCKIICVGNAMSGGTGKTPLVIKLIEILNITNNRLAVVAGGYSGNFTCKASVIRVDRRKHVARHVGDEALLLAKYARTYVSKNRVKAVIRAKKDGAKIIIMDDGLQNNKIFKNISICIWPLTIRNKFPVPAGPMRELSASVLSKSDVIVIDEELDNVTSRLFKGKLVIQQKQIIKNVQDLRRHRYILVCGIARPERVLQKLSEHDIRIVEKIFFPDHYFFQEKELFEICSRMRLLYCRILTTSKDFTRIPAKFHVHIDVIQLDIVLNPEEGLLRKLMC
jgi:tetraacyldisaccharide 4'-kinase